jgi:hypothetical protein
VSKISPIIFVLVALGAQLAPAQAQLARTYVSAVTGNDANDCNRLTPCRTFGEAHNKTLANGEITVLDPGGYGAVTITKTISIINDGVGEAGVLVSGGATGITINAGAADAVSLRGLTVKGIGFGGGNGIQFNSGKSLTIENCAIRNLTGTSPIGFGVDFRPTASSSLAVSNTLVADNDNIGIHVRPTGSGTVVATFSRAEVYNSGLSGLFVIGSSSSGTIKATVVDSVAAGNGSTGFGVASAGAPSSLMVVRSVSANNLSGMSASFASATLRVGQSTVTGNAASLPGFNGAIVRSYGDNDIDGNGDGNPGPTTIARK